MLPIIYTPLYTPYVPGTEAKRGAYSTPLEALRGSSQLVISGWEPWLKQ